MASPCHFLNMAPELRNEIYRLVFEPDQDSDTETLLCEATPPSIDVLKTCKKVYGEAKGLYATACRQYWTESHFKIKEENAEGWDPAHIAGVNEKELNLLRHLRVDESNGGSTIQTSTLIDVRGGWEVETRQGQRRGFIRIHTVANESYFYFAHNLDMFDTKAELLHACVTHGQEVPLSKQIGYICEYFVL
ncbi:unnamed protein product [Zymoseptoria tritici ST99CH_3D7]|uniref:Uncharacterized protein n=1 Tax=Zymoseptoria tritici (strain ST99CH_3D7) TaxID=1276538 RepID=A0A1X7RCI0_ZYMT9|nr:unnamed protein product [Zymoseptoria tritici ST99CH_3D7]